RQPVRGRPPRGASPVREQADTPAATNVTHRANRARLQIPTEAERAFRLKPNTDSEGSRTPVPTEPEQRFRAKPNTRRADPRRARPEPRGEGRPPVRPPHPATGRRRG